MGGFIIGVLVGFVFLAMIATGKSADMLRVIQQTAIENDPTYCRKYLKDNQK